VSGGFSCVSNQDHSIDGNDRTSIEINHKPFEIVKKSQIGAGAAIKIERASYEVGGMTAPPPILANALDSLQDRMVDS
jgi:hypothetical protein